MSNILHHRVASNHNTIACVLWYSVPIALAQFLKTLWMCSPSSGVSFGLLGITVSVVGGRWPLFFCNAVPCSPLGQASGASFSATFQQLCYCAPLVRVFDLYNACCNLSHTWGGKSERFASQRSRCAACACSFITFSFRANVCAMIFHKSAQRGSRTPKKAQVVCSIFLALILFVNEVLRTSNI